MTSPAMSSYPNRSGATPVLGAPSVLPVAHRLERVVPVALGAVLFVVAVLNITTWPVGAFEDDAIYTLLAKALATGDGYRMINLPGAPFATHYPPGYPALLAVLWKAWPAFPDNIVAFKFMNAVLLAAAGVGIYWLVRHRLQHRPAIAAVIAFAAIGVMPFPQMAGLVLSEPLFFAMLFPAVLAAERAVDTGRMSDAALAGILLGALCLVRTVGVAAVGAAMLVLLTRRRFGAMLVVLAMAALFLVPWQWWTGAHASALAPALNGKYGPYLSWMVDGYREGGVEFARQVVFRNLADMGSSLSLRVMPFEQPLLHMTSLVLLLVMLGAGLVVLYRRIPTLVLFSLLYAGLIILWPFHPYRFLLALWPALVIAAAAAISALWGWQPRTRVRHRLRHAALGAVGFVVVGHLGYNWDAYREGAWVRLQERVGISAKPMVDWVLAHTQPDDVIASHQDVLVYLYTGRRAVPPSTFLPRQRLQPLTTTEEAHWMSSVVRAYQVRFVVTGWPPHIAAADSLTTGPSPVLRRAGSIPHHVVFERTTP